MYFSTIFKWKALSIIRYLVIFRSTFKKEGAICNSVLRVPLGSRGKLAGVAGCRAAGRGSPAVLMQRSAYSAAATSGFGFEHFGLLVAHINCVAGWVIPYRVRAGVLPRRLWFRYWIQMPER